MTLNVILEQTESNWCAFTPDDIGVVASTGKNRDEAIQSFRAALRGHLEAMQAEGLPVPAIENLNIQELIPI
jgi:predicted RNase H-like HicB family nuclease